MSHVIDSLGFEMLSVAPIAGACTHQTIVPPALFRNLREGFVTDFQGGTDTKR
jgi:hypothetical protein